MHPQIYSTNRATLIDLKAIRFTVAEDGTSQKIVAFRKLNLNRFKELLAIAGASTDEVEVMRGCIITHGSLRKVAKDGENREFRF
jgi:hypothetical protein